MYCSECGANISDKSMFCNVCGANQSNLKNTQQNNDLIKMYKKNSKKGLIVGIISLFLIILSVIILVVFKPYEHSKKEIISDNKKRVNDEANLLSDNDIKELEKRVNELSNKYECDIVIITVDSIDGEDPNKYANDYFSSNGYGMGKYKSGISLLISMGTSDYAVTAHSVRSDVGAQRKFTYKETDSISSAIVKNLSEGKFYEAFDNFIDKTEYYLSENDEQNTAYFQNDEKEWYGSTVVSMIETAFYGSYECSDFSSYGIFFTLEINESGCSITTRDYGYGKDSIKNGDIKLQNGKILFKFDDEDMIGYFEDSITIIVTINPGDYEEELIFVKQ